MYYTGEEFAILVEAKEILTNKESRMKYDNEYKLYQKKLERRKEEQVRRAKMSHFRQQKINDLEAAEQRARNKRKAEYYKNHIYRITKESIEQELIRMREEMRKEEKRKINEKINRMREKKKEEKLKRKSLIIKLDKTKTNKPYSSKELNSIFSVYGKINEINMISNDKYNGAEIIFNKTKYVQQAFKSEETLRNEFYLIIVNNNNNNEKNKRKNVEEKWGEFVDRRQKQFNHQQYEQFVWNKVEQFMNDNQV